MTAKGGGGDCTLFLYGPKRMGNASVKDASGTLNVKENLQEGICLFSQPLMVGEGKIF